MQVKSKYVVHRDCNNPINLTLPTFCSTLIFLGPPLKESSPVSLWYHVVFLHIRYYRYIIIMMSVPYIGNIWWPSMKGCVPWIINHYLLLSFIYYIWYLIKNNYIINYYSKIMSSRCCPNINTSSQRGRHFASCQACLWSIQTSP